MDEEDSLGIPDPPGAREAILYSLTNRGFFSEFNILAYVLAYSAITDRKIFVGEDGDGTFFRKLFATQLPHHADLVADGYDTVIDMHPKANRPEWNAMRTWIRDACLQRLRVCLPWMDFEGEVSGLISHMARALFRPRQSIIAQAREAERELGLQGVPYCAIQIRRGDKTEGYLNAKGQLVVETQAAPFSAYAERLSRVAPQIRDVLVLTDDYEAFEEATACAHDLRLRTLCSTTERGYVHREHASLPAPVRLERLEKLLASVILASRSEAFVGTNWSNLSTAIYLLHGRQHRCASIDPPQEWPPSDPLLLPGLG